MRRTLGVDVGATLCKIVPLDAPEAAVYCSSEAWGEVRTHVLAHAPTRVGATGGGASRLGGVLPEVPITPVGEFEAWAAGASILAAADGPLLPPPPPAAP